MSWTSVPGVALRLLGGTLVTAVLLLGPGATGASAHDVLVGTAPAGDASVAAAPAQVALELSRPPQALGTRVLVSGPGGAQVSAGPAELHGTRVVQPLADDLPAGRYTVQWRVTSSDGHPLSGTSTFTIAPGSAGAGNPVPAAAVGAAALSPVPEGGRPTGHLVWGAGAALAAATGVLGLRLRRRQR